MPNMIEEECEEGLGWSCGCPKLQVLSIRRSLYMLSTSYIRQQVATSIGSLVVVAAVILPLVPRAAAWRSTVRFVISDRLSMTRPRSEPGNAGIFPGPFESLMEEGIGTDWEWSLLTLTYQLPPLKRDDTVGIEPLVSCFHEAKKLRPHARSYLMTWPLAI